MCSMKCGVCYVRFFVKCLAETCGLTKRDSWFNDLWIELQGERLKTAFSPDIILCG